MNEQEEKKALRKTMLARRDQLGYSARQTASQVVCDLLWALIRQRQAQVIHTFLPMGSEIDIQPVLAQALQAGLTVVAPKTLPQRRLQHFILQNPEAVEPGIFGTRFPSGGIEYSGAYDLIIVPGLAFTPAGYRLGYGGGYYDTFLAKHPQAYKVGVAYAIQMIERLPVETHDQCLDQIIKG